LKSPAQINTTASTNVSLIVGAEARSV